MRERGNLNWNHHANLKGYLSLPSLYPWRERRGRIRPESPNCTEFQMKKARIILFPCTQEISEAANVSRFSLSLPCLQAPRAAENQVAKNSTLCKVCVCIEGFFSFLSLIEACWLFALTDSWRGASAPQAKISFPWIFTFVHSRFALENILGSNIYCEDWTLFHWFE